MTRVVEAGAVICNGEFLNLLHCARVLDGDGGVVAERMQKEHLVVGETLHSAVDKLNHAEDAVFRFEWHADDRTRLPLRHLIDPLCEARIVIHVWNQQRLAVFGDPSSDAFSDLKTDAFECVSCIADGNGEVQLVFLLIDHQQRPGVRTEEDRHLFHDGLQNGVEVERRREGFRDIVEDTDLFHLPFAIGSGGLSH